MTTSVIKLAVGFAWAAFAISSAAPADARAITAQSGGYANCSASATPAVGTIPCNNNQGEPQPFHATHQQNIKLVTTLCGSGACSPDANVVNTNMVYPAGRKPTVPVRTCWNSPLRIYDLGSCAC